MRGNNDLKFPVTIEELKDFCEIKGISLYQHNFYLGSDHIGANAHGIYKDYWSGDFIVYRNMEDGSKEVMLECKGQSTGHDKMEKGAKPGGEGASERTESQPLVW